MPPREPPDIPVFRRREGIRSSAEDRRLRAGVASGALIRVVPGSFVRAVDWAALTPIDRHLVFVIEALDRLDDPATVVGAAAAAVWGIDRLEQWPNRVETVVERTAGGRSSGLFRRMTRLEPDLETVPWRGHRLTTPAQTALDIARTGSILHGRVAVDQALWLRRPGGPLVSPGEVRARFEASRPGAGDQRVREVIGKAEGLSDSVRETQSVHLIERLGFPRPMQQKRFVLLDGRTVFSDVYFAAFDHAGEFDGVGNYLDPSLLRGRTPQQALIAEKDRGDALRRCVRGLSRWRTPALEDPRLLHDILTADGVPSSRPRPPAGLLL